MKKYNHNLISCLRIYLQDCEENLKMSPSKLVNSIRPRFYTNYAWVPQTIGDQIWVYYEFESLKLKEEWENSLPDYAKKMLNNDLVKSISDYGWNIRDYNGFIV